MSDMSKNSFWCASLLGSKIVFLMGTQKWSLRCKIAIRVIIILTRNFNNIMTRSSDTCMQWIEYQTKRRCYYRLQESIMLYMSIYLLTVILPTLLHVYKTVSIKVRIIKIILNHLRKRWRYKNILVVLEKTFDHFLPSRDMSFIFCARTIVARAARIIVDVFLLGM